MGTEHCLEIKLQRFINATFFGENPIYNIFKKRKRIITDAYYVDFLTFFQSSVSMKI